METGTLFTAIGILTGIVGMTVAVTNMFTNRDQAAQTKEDLRQKAENNYVEQLERRLTRTEDELSACRKARVDMQQQMTDLKVETFEMLRRYKVIEDTKDGN